MLRQVSGMSFLSALLLTGCAATQFDVHGSFPASLAVAAPVPAPPPPRYEVIPVAPSREHVWVPGAGRRALAWLSSHREDARRRDHRAPAPGLFERFA